MPEKIGAPSVKGMKESWMDYAVGMGGGLLFGISSALFGSGLIGGLISTGLAGSMIKGTRGEIIATTLGFQSALSFFGGGGSEPEAVDTGSSVI